jgi:hypothetical protein
MPSKRQFEENGHNKTHSNRRSIMKELSGIAVGLLVVGLVGALMGGSILPLLVIGAVLWALGSFLGGSGR